MIRYDTHIYLTSITRVSWYRVLTVQHGAPAIKRYSPARHAMSKFSYKTEF